MKHLSKIKINEDSKIPKPKATSFGYGIDHQLNQADKYRNRNTNHWKIRIELAHNLVVKYVLPLHQTKSKKDIVVVDVGCSIGTFAIEFARLGYDSDGIDFDSSAIEVAKVLSTEENVTPKFVCGDVSEWTEDFPPIDIAICFDIFEHLHDDELGSFLSSIRRQFSKNGAIVFHTYPTQYDYVFYGLRPLRYPLLPFRNISQSTFTNIVKAYSCLMDVLFLVKSGKTHKESIKYIGHCNPTTSERLTEILNRSGYKVIFMELSNLYNFEPVIHKQFYKQPITLRNLYGVAIPKTQNIERPTRRCT